MELLFVEVITIGRPNNEQYNHIFSHIFKSKNRPFTRRGGAFKADGSLNDNDRVEIGPTDLAFNEWAELG